MVRTSPWRELFLRILGILLVIVVTTILFWQIRIIVINKILSLDDLKTVSDVIYNVTISLSAIFGGVWAYYKFIKGRLFANKVDLSFRHEIVDVSKSDLMVFIEFRSKNIGSAVLEPELFLVNVSGCRLVDGQLQMEKLFSENLIEDNTPWYSIYVEPNEEATQSKIFLVPKTCQALSVSVQIQYARSYQTGRDYFIDLKNTPKSRKSKNDV